MAISIYEGPDPCRVCEGWKQVDTHDGASRKTWAELPPASRVAYDAGLVEFETCLRCGGTGREPAETPNTDVLLKTKDLIGSGYAGVLPNGNIVDRREHPDAVPVQKNALFGAPSPKEV